MDMRTPLGKVRGLGSAKEGTEHFWRQRLTAVANIPLIIFFVEVAVLTALMGSSFGQRIMGIRIVSVTHGRLDPLRAVLRTLLLCLVVPPLIFDRDQRGLHDRAAGSVAVRMGHAAAEK